ncbi:MAG: hypothetical protein HOP28_03495 [Gemmatimonadales bacterium]|nr:hypothetical protein [Gemmatimonadales bacterium]
MRHLTRAVLFLTIPALLSAQEGRPLPAGAEAWSLTGQPLAPPALAADVREGHERRLAIAKLAFDRAPGNADSIIWLGRRTAYLGRYREALGIFTRGIALHPNDPRLYRHRGHRYLTVRRLDDAIADLERAASLIRAKPDEVEPDGIPNARGIPTSTLHSNIRYHLGLAHYLKGDFTRAASVFAEDVTAALATKNVDMLVASSHWRYMALRRAGRGEEAALVLRPIVPELPVIENGSYHRLLLLYKGALSADSLLAPKPASGTTVEDVTIGYGVGNWHLYNGRVPQGRALFAELLRSPQWAAFGYLAAEAEVARSGVKP